MADSTLSIMLINYEVQDLSFGNYSPVIMVEFEETVQKSENFNKSNLQINEKLVFQVKKGGEPVIFEIYNGTNSEKPLGISKLFLKNFKD